jgi:hypothetical protein
MKETLNIATVSRAEAITSDRSFPFASVRKWGLHRRLFVAVPEVFGKGLNKIELTEKKYNRDIRNWT